jgi:hypothetical protein
MGASGDAQGRALISNLLAGCSFVFALGWLWSQQSGGWLEYASAKGVEQRLVMAGLAALWIRSLARISQNGCTDPDRSRPFGAFRLWMAQQVMTLAAIWQRRHPEASVALDGSPAPSLFSLGRALIVQAGTWMSGCCWEPATRQFAHWTWRPAYRGRDRTAPGRERCDRSCSNSISSSGSPGSTWSSSSSLSAISTCSG